ncbi:MAG: hypothetical protein EBR82_22735 [Caulobacteraceae bacterium]|nr:hypothetical protein [Caulobacteraceae bacterium]
MGLIRDIYEMNRQSEMDDLTKKRMNQEMELKQKYYEKQMQLYNDANQRRNDVYAGISELGELDKAIGETSFQKTMLEQRFQQSSLKDPDEAKQFMIESQVAAKRLQDLNAIRKIKGAELTYRSIDGGFAKAKALELADFLNGKEPSESGMATIKKTRKYLDDNGEEQSEVVTMKVPQSQAGLGGYVGKQDQAQEESGYNPYGMASAMVDSTSPLGEATPEYARPAYQSQSQGMLVRDVANVQASGGTPQPMQATQAKPQADTEAVRQQALAAMSRAQTPEQRQKIKDRAAQMGVNLP